MEDDKQAQIVRQGWLQKRGAEILQFELSFD